MIRRLLPRSEFARHALTLMTGTTLAQAIPIAISPVLTRLFTPEDFGVLALYVAIVAFLGIAATGRYELAVMLPESDDDADALVILSCLVALGVGAVLLVLVALTHDWLVALLGQPQIAGWLYLVPFSVVVVGCYSALNYWLNRNRQYRRMSANRVLQSGLGATLQLAGGAAKLGPAALIPGQFLGQFVTAAQLAVSFWKAPRPATRGPLVPRLSELAHRYRHHPQHLLPAQWIGAAAMQLPIFALSALFGPAVTGFYSLANRIVVLPTTLVATALGDVYRQRAAEAYRAQGEFSALYIRTLLTALALAVVPTAFIVLWAPDIFSWVFGHDWRTAGELARILALASFFQFVFTPLDKGALIVGATTYIFWWHMLRLLAILSVAAATWLLTLTLTQFVLLYALANGAMYLLDGWVEFKLSLPSEKEQK